jgi:hypothetical protein
MLWEIAYFCEFLIDRLFLLDTDQYLDTLTPFLKTRITVQYQLASHGRKRVRR